MNDFASFFIRYRDEIALTNHTRSFRSDPVRDEAALILGLIVIRAVVAEAITGRDLAGQMKEIPGHAGQPEWGLLVPDRVARIGGERPNKAYSPQGSHTADAKLD
ncbi:hypothetical protein ACVWZM_005241 [Bradyrhizobium sp. USDA 4501]